MILEFFYAYYKQGFELTETRIFKQPLRQENTP
jgi:hypothetical protein